MAYEVYRSGKNGFRLYFVDYSVKPKKQTKVEPEAYTYLGFSKEMFYEEALARKNQLNSQKKLEAKSIRERDAVLKITQTLKHDSLIEDAFLPQQQIIAFEKHLEDLGYSKLDKQKKKIFSRWMTVQKLIRHLAIPPEKYTRNSNSIKIYKWFAQNEYAPDTVKKLIHVLNLWGEFVLDEQDKSYAPVKMPESNFKQEIRDSYLDSDTFRSESDPLTPEILQKIQKDLTVPGNYEWLYISIWFGLRPGEIDSLKNTKRFSVEFDAEKNVKILWVFQSKLGKIDREKRWKMLPIIVPEQEKALEYILERNFKRPLLKTLKKHTPGYITLYGGRKGFQSLFTSKLGRSIYEVSQWLGHKSLDMTISRYRNRLEVTLEK